MDTHPPALSTNNDEPERQWHKPDRHMGALVSR